MPLHLIHESTSSSTAAASQNGRESVEKRPSRPNDNIYKKKTLDLCLSLVFNCEKNKINKLHSWLLIQFQVQQKEEKISSLQFENEKKNGRKKKKKNRLLRGEKREEWPFIFMYVYINIWRASIVENSVEQSETTVMAPPLSLSQIPYLNFI